MRFEEIKVEYSDRITNAVASAGLLSCQFSAVSLYCYAQKYQTEISFSGGFLFVKQMLKEIPVCYYLPVPEDGNSSVQALAGAIERLISYHQKHYDGNFVLWGIADDTRTDFEEASKSLGLSGSAVSDRNWAEYIHTPENLINMKGKRFHAKKNAVNQFLRNNGDYVYEPLDRNNLSEVRALQEGLLKGSRKFMTSADTLNTLEAEHIALTRGLDNFEELSLAGGLIRIDGDVCAFAFGGPIGNHSFDISFEKGLRNYNGIFQVLEQDMLKTNVCGYEYINREEDLGEPGLRFAKERLRPDILLMKYTFTAKG